MRHPPAAIQACIPAVLTCAAGGPILMGCASQDNDAPPFAVSIEQTLTLPSVGAGQGLSAAGGTLYAYGDAETGVLLQVMQGGAELAVPPVALTDRGEDIIPHPTGLAIADGYPTFLGNTVRGVGTIYCLDLNAAFADGVLDHAVLGSCVDDLSINGCRPEYVRVDDRWLVATADYGDDRNQLRLYDPEALAACEHTSDSGVLARAFDCGPWVQSLEWIDSLGVLVLVQNQIPGLLYRLTFCELHHDRLVALGTLDLDAPADELEGFALTGGGTAVMLSSAPRENLHRCRITFQGR